MLVGFFYYDQNNQKTLLVTKQSEHGLVGVLQDVILDVCGSQPIVIWRRDCLGHHNSLVPPRNPQLRRL